MDEPTPALTGFAGPLMLACAFLATVSMFANLGLLRSTLDRVDSGGATFGMLVMLAASGTGCWIALRTLHVTADRSVARKLAMAGLIANAIPVLIVAVVWTGVSRVADMPQPPVIHADVRQKEPQAEKPVRPGREPVVNADGLIAGTRVRANVVKLEQVLYEEGPSTLARVGQVYRRAGHLASKLRGMRRTSEIHPDSVDPAAAPYLKRAEELVADFQQHVTQSLIVWTGASSPSALRQRWEPLRDRYFTREPWMKHGSSELSMVQDERKPNIDSDLMMEISALQSLVADLERRTELDHEWASHVSSVLQSTRVWSSKKEVAESMRDRKVKGWKRTENLGPDGPRKLMDAYSRMRSVCESFFYYLPTPHRVTEKHKTRPAASSRQRLDMPWRDLMELQQP